MTTKKHLELKIKNPHKEKSDCIPVHIKLFWKTFIAPLLGSPHHQTIIPKTQLHPAWILGAQPGNHIIKKLLGENPCEKIHIINLLSDSERIITEKNHFVENGKVKVSRMPLHDHSTINMSTGKNQTVEAIVEFQKNLYKEFTKKPAEELFYCHCMAGKARSFVETMAFIYFYPDKKTLFDFENWPKEIRETIPLNLQERLKDNPSFSDIDELVRIRRPKVKTLLQMDGDQAGILGLMTLDNNVHDPKITETRDKIRRYKDAQNIGLILETPLDLAFRDEKDLKEQEKKLVSAYKIYQKQNINLLMAMVVSIYKHAYLIRYKTDFEKHFQNLAPSEQARFAILAKKLEDKKCDLSPLKNALYYAKISVKNTKKLTAGDQVELLKTFGICTIKNLEPKNIIKKILHGNKLDRYNAGIQLAELFHLINPDEATIKKTVKKLPKNQRIKFADRIEELKNPRIKIYARRMIKGYLSKLKNIFGNSKN